MCIRDSLYAEPLPIKMCYISCPVFRYEKPQSGRLREHHQLGVEVFGAKDASVDAEIIRLALDVQTACGIDGLRVAINSIGCPKCRGKYHEILKDYLRPKLGELCKTCNERFERNPLRVLDCKECTDKVKDAPSMLDTLCDECKEHFEALKRNLTALGIEYQIDSRIVRGLDYYTCLLYTSTSAFSSAGHGSWCPAGRQLRCWSAET